MFFSSFLLTPSTRTLSQVFSASAKPDINNVNENNNNWLNLIRLEDKLGKFSKNRANDACHHINMTIVAIKV
ncbi:hypothetical protein GCM10009410_25750 [Shewanella ulleungensis]|uniref:Secreted protein n=1 Tax=Shewanella ulleungensis TaxID=2282699 RepID=A0ABQ2QRD4_9GAMM|nr:hypothetical protein GCM10009410_25750 [Shewanella ulleungensis]